MKFNNYSNRELIYYRILFIFICTSAMRISVHTLYFFYDLASYALKYGSLALGIYLIIILIIALTKQYKENKDKHFYISLSLFCIGFILFIISVYFNIMMFVI